MAVFPEEARAERRFSGWRKPVSRVSRYLKVTGFWGHVESAEQGGRPHGWRRKPPYRSWNWILLAKRCLLGEEASVFCDSHLGTWYTTVVPLPLLPNLAQLGFLHGQRVLISLKQDHTLHCWQTHYVNFKSAPRLSRWFWVIQQSIHAPQDTWFY